MNDTPNMGWVRLDRGIIGTTIWKNHNLFRVWVWCLMRASWAERLITVGLTKVYLEPGQFVFGRKAAAEELGVSPSTLYDCLQRLVADNKLDIKSDNKKSVITVVNWVLYQSESTQSDSKSNNKTDSRVSPTSNPAAKPVKPDIKSDNKKIAEPESNQAISGVAKTESDIKSDSKTEKSGSNSGTNNNIKQLNNINNNNRTMASPVDNSNLTTRLRMLLGTDVAQHWLTDPQYGPDYCVAQMAHMDRQAGIRNPRTWLLAALNSNYAEWKPPSPKPDPHCPHCNGTGRYTDWSVYPPMSHPCTCVPQPASVQQPPAPQAADPTHRDTAAVTARLSAALTP